MVYENMLEFVNLIANEKLVRPIVIIVTLLIVLVGVFVSSFTAFILYVFYVSGYIVSWFCIKYRKKTITYLKRLSSFYHGRITINQTLKHSCSICDDLSCKRHLQTANVTPWKHLHVNSDLNTAIEQFYNRILENFIISWYAQFTEDYDFINELRYCLKYASAAVINRFLELDVAHIIANKLIPCTIKHIDDYLYMQQIAKLRNTRFDNVVIEYLGRRLHAATTNRRNELGYLQHLVASLLVYILPETHLKCGNYSVMMREIIAGWVFLPLMDVLADPNIINSLVIFAVTYKPKKLPKINQKSDSIEFLQNYETSNNNKKSSFATNLNKIKNNTDLLYAFMQFLKKEEHVNLLQFCLDVDDFNVKLLTPDLTKKQLEELHRDALKLYKEYLDKESFNFISCPTSISQDFNYLVINIYSIEKLTKLSKLLYKAYDHTFNALENIWLPQFFHSNEFYTYICGSKITPTYDKLSANSSPVKDRTKRYIETTNQGTVAKISSSLGKIKGVLKANQPIEGSFFPLEPHSVENGTVEDILLSECKTLFRDLSTWRVSIPLYQASPSNRVIYFCIHVERMDIISDENKRTWTILRKDQDFYTLKAKLVEFHGENEICDSPLPSRKAGSSIDTRMLKYEVFLKKLLRKPILRGSDLLYSFLTIEEDFTMFVTTNASNLQDIGNIYQSVAYKLRKEKGQHLDSFLTAFLNSTGKNKNEKLEWAEVGEELDILISNKTRPISFPKTYRNHIFNDNFGVQYKLLKDTMCGSFSPDGFVECVFYLLKDVFKIPNYFLKLYASFCTIAQQIVDLTSRMIIEHKLKLGLCQSNLTYLIKLLEDVIFNTHISPSKEELENRKAKAFSVLDQAVPIIISKIFGNGVHGGLNMLLEILQHPHYNKQLVYNLLDIILTEMYPTLQENQDVQ